MYDVNVYVRFADFPLGEEIWPNVHRTLRIWNGYCYADYKVTDVTFLLRENNINNIIRVVQVENWIYDIHYAYTHQSHTVTGTKMEFDVSQVMGAQFYMYWTDLYISL